MKINQFERGKVSILMVTYNRGVLIKNSIESLLNQTYKNIEIIIVDNGSTDNTSSVLQQYDAPEFSTIIRRFRLEENRNFTGGGNFALEQIKGEWFTFLDDDDIAFPHAIETMMRLPEKINSKINAITCNCINSSTGQFGGSGLKADQYLPLKKIVRRCKGEFWGITKTELLQNARFNENLIGYEDTFGTR
ncbi:MAG: glycosyltransferase family 2 protein [Saprospiraceae bacterium]|nr:glycosyltransferase family 2 protein [Saprospiraceae bacterium]